MTVLILNPMEPIIYSDNKSFLLQIHLCYLNGIIRKWVFFALFKIHNIYINSIIFFSSRSCWQYMIPDFKWNSICGILPLTNDQFLLQWLIQNWFHSNDWGGTLWVNITTGVIKESTAWDWRAETIMDLMLIWNSNDQGKGASNGKDLP